MSDVDNSRPIAAQEPSMEDILSSIRRILSEDGEGVDADAVAPVIAASKPGAEPTARVPEPAPDAEADAQSSPRRKSDHQRPAVALRGNAVEEIDFSDSEDETPVRAQSNVFHLTPEMRLPPERQVLSQTTSTASTDVLSQLAKAILDRRDIGVGGRDMTIEGLVREMLRPLLREWLDRNLPYLIERLVKKEIDLMVNRAERLED